VGCGLGRGERALILGEGRQPETRPNRPAASANRFTPARSRPAPLKQPPHKHLAPPPGQTPPPHAQRTPQQRDHPRPHVVVAERRDERGGDPQARERGRDVGGGAPGVGGPGLDLLPGEALLVG